MYKDIIKIMLIVFIISSYLINLLVMFIMKPINILIGNIICLCLLIVSILISIFIDWLNDK